MHCTQYMSSVPDDAVALTSQVCYMPWHIIIVNCNSVNDHSSRPISWLVHVDY